VRQSTKARDYPRFPAAVCEQRVASTVTTPFGRVSCDKPAGSNVKVVTNRISKCNGVAALMGLRKVCVLINQSTKETLTESQLRVLGPLNPRARNAETLTHTNHHLTLSRWQRNHRNQPRKVQTAQREC
jgi:hypothetical protein